MANRGGNRRMPCSILQYGGPVTSVLSRAVCIRRRCEYEGGRASPLAAPRGTAEFEKPMSGISDHDDGPASHGAGLTGNDHPRQNSCLRTQNTGADRLVPSRRFENVTFDAPPREAPTPSRRSCCANRGDEERRAIYVPERRMPSLAWPECRARVERRTRGRHVVYVKVRGAPLAVWSGPVAVVCVRKSLPKSRPRSENLTPSARKRPADAGALDGGLRLAVCIRGLLVCPTSMKFASFRRLSRGFSGSHASLFARLGRSLACSTRRRWRGRRCSRMKRFGVNWTLPPDCRSHCLWYSSSTTGCRKRFFPPAA